MSDTIKQEYDEIERKNSWQLEFVKLKERSDVEAREKNFTWEHAKLNRKFNRYRDVNPYDHSRIVLNRQIRNGNEAVDISASADTENTDYINANLVKCEAANRQYILTQGPLPITVSHFWLMAWQQNSTAILMLNKLIEKKQVKCHQYWPADIGKEHALELTDVGLRVEYMRHEEYENFCIRTFHVTDTRARDANANQATGGEHFKEIFQFHYMTWPDFGIPSSPNAFLQFLKKVRAVMAETGDQIGPPIVHCSAGIGRSGTYCLVDSCLVLVDKFQEENVSVQDVLIELRRYRLGLIQTMDQLYFSYQAIIEGIKLFNDPEWCKLPLTPVQKAVADAEDEPPPLPPPRTESLQMPAKPLPQLPGVDQVMEEDGEVLPPSRLHDQMQPLPQIPMDEGDDDDEDEDDDDEDESAIESCNSSAGEEEEDEMHPKSAAAANAMDTVESGKENGDANSPASTLSGGNGEEEEEEAAAEQNKLRKRIVREDKQKAMADMVKDIKRKQRETEEDVTAAKKRRSLLVKITLAAVLIGFVCIYYSRK